MSALGSGLLSEGEAAAPPGLELFFSLFTRGRRAFGALAPGYLLEPPPGAGVTGNPTMLLRAIPRCRRGHQPHRRC